MAIGSHNALKVGCIFSMTFWVVVGVCWFRDAHFMGSYEKGGYLMMAFIFLPPIGVACYLLIARSLWQAVSASFIATPFRVVTLVICGLSPLIPISIGLFLMIRKVFE